MPLPAVSVAKLNPEPLPINSWPFVGVADKPVPPLATASVPAVKSAASRLVSALPLPAKLAAVTAPLNVPVVLVIPPLAANAPVRVVAPVTAKVPPTVALLLKLAVVPVKAPFNVMLPKVGVLVVAMLCGRLRVMVPAPFVTLIWLAVPVSVPSV